MADAASERAAHRADLAEGRKSAPTANPEEIKERNRKALEARKAKLAAMKEAEKNRQLPPGWRMVESRSRPGEYVYENINTEERQAWFPEEAAPEEVSGPLVAMSEDDKKKEELKKRNMEALAKRKAKLKEQKEKEKELALPEGWKRVESRSRPGEMVYENTVTGERQAWFPDAPAAANEDEAKKLALIEKNKQALAKRKAALAAKEVEEASKPLPEGWRRVESRSRPGEFVYENIYTEERQSWFPETAAAKPLPDGWRKVESRTYPGEFVYENVHTLERQAWEPTEPASTQEAQIKAPAAAPAAAPAKDVICKAKVLYDYTADNRDEEIDLLEGDIIEVEYKAGNGWWVGKNTRTGNSGIFPGTYVEEM